MAQLSVFGMGLDGPWRLLPCLRPIGRTVRIVVRARARHYVALFGRLLGALLCAGCCGLTHVNCPPMIPVRSSLFAPDRGLLRHTTGSLYGRCYSCLWPAPCTET